MLYMASQMTLVVKNLPANVDEVKEAQVQSLDQEAFLEKGMATHSSTLV